MIGEEVISQAASVDESANQGIEESGRAVTAFAGESEIGACLLFWPLSDFTT